MEQVPKKKARKALKKGKIFLILACAAALIGAGAYFLRPKPVVPDIPEKAEPIYLLSRPADEIAAIAISPREGTAYPLVMRDQTLRLLGQPDMPLREWLVEDILTIVTAFCAEDVVVDTAAETGGGLLLAAFGLEPPVVTVTVTYQDGQRVEVRLGNLTPSEDETRYCMVAGDSRVFTVLAEESRLFLYEMDYLRAFDQPKIDASLLDRVDIAGDVTFGAYYTASGWQMDAPYVYPLSTVRTDQLLKNIEGMGFEALLGSKQDMDLAKYGLDHPALTVTLTQAPTVITGENEAGETVEISVPSVRYVLEIGDETGKSGVYLTWQGNVYKASNFVLGFWKQFAVEDMLLRNPVNLLVNDLGYVALEAEGVSAAYEVRMVESLTENNQIETDEYGNYLYDCAVRRAGEKQDMDAEAFLEWYIRLARLTPSGTLPDGYQVSGSPRATITLKNDRLTRQIALYPCDALHDALAVDGVALYYVEKSWLNRVIDTP